MWPEYVTVARHDAAEMNPRAQHREVRLGLHCCGEGEHGRQRVVGIMVHEHDGIADRLDENVSSTRQLFAMAQNRSATSAASSSPCASVEARR